MSNPSWKRNTFDINKLVSAANGGATEEKNHNPSQDDRYWNPTRDKAGNGYAVLRFLPPPEGNDLPWARYWDHAFKGPTGQWYIEKSLTSIGQQDPLSELNSKMWNSGVEADKATVRQRKRNLRYVTNVLVLQDPAAPQNEGQVKLYRFGKKIFDKIMDAMQPQFPDEAPVNPFDPLSGADFTLKIRKVDGYPNYDASSFKSPSSLFDGDEAAIDGVYSKVHDLNEFSDPNNYKSYDQLKARLATVLGESSTRAAANMVEDEIPNFDAPRAVPAAAAPSESFPTAAEASSQLEDDDDTLKYFAKLAAED